ncbi:MAG TPA: YceI family protein [Gaiellaceae bacterium]|jgi:polyisoprenoid-binding protein YceI|nr:YceI family protein [Gaiellaceae bacterium]
MAALDTTVKALPEGAFALDPAHSSVAFEVKHLGIATVRGRFTVISGTLTGGESPSLEGVVDMASATTFDEQRDGHLASPDFFDAQRFPQATFRSTSFEQLADGSVRVIGGLTLKGVKKEIELAGSIAGPATDPWGSERIGLELSGVIDRNDFGVKWNAPLPGGGFLLPDDVRIVIDVSAVKGA